MATLPSYDETTDSRRMHPTIRAILDAHNGILTAASALSYGVNGTMLARQVKRGQLIRVGQGAYVDRHWYQAEDESGRHLLRVRAIAATVPESVALSHYSAAVAWELPILGEIPSLAHFSRLSPGPNRSCGSHRIHRQYPTATAVEIGDLTVIDPAHTALGIAAKLGFNAAVVAADAALHRGLVQTSALADVVASCASWPGVTALRAALPILDAKSESPGESLTRLLLIELGFPCTSQEDIHDARDRLIGRVDFLIDQEYVAVEFDGAVKYVEDDANPRPNTVLFQEKLREDALRDAGYEVVRLSWADLRDPDGVRRRIRAAIARSRRRRAALGLEPSRRAS